MKKYWWKILCMLILMYCLWAAFLLDVPRLPILNETIRNLYFHVPMWFTMIFLFLLSFIQSIKYLNKGQISHDIKAFQYAHVGFAFGILGIITGMVWANFTWGRWWANDPKLNGSAISLLMYSAYFILRNAISDEDKRAKLSAVYNIFAFVLMLVFIGILPRLTDSLHPGNGGNPGFNNYDLDHTMKWVFRPAVLGWILLGVWIAQIRIKLDFLNQKQSI